MPSPYNGAVGSISAACVSRLSEETINWASLSSSAVSALFDTVSFIAGSFISLFSPIRQSIIAPRFRRPGERPPGSGRAGKSAVDHDHLAGKKAVRLNDRQ